MGVLILHLRTLCASLRHVTERLVVPPGASPSPLDLRSAALGVEPSALGGSGGLGGSAALGRGERLEDQRRQTGPGVRKVPGLLARPLRRHMQDAVVGQMRRADEVSEPLQGGGVDQGREPSQGEAEDDAGLDPVDVLAPGPRGGGEADLQVLARDCDSCSDGEVVGDGPLTNAVRRLRLGGSAEASALAVVVGGARRLALVDVGQAYLIRSALPGFAGRCAVTVLAASRGACPGPVAGVPWTGTERRRVLGGACRGDAPARQPLRRGSGGSDGHPGGLVPGADPPPAGRHPRQPAQQGSGAHQSILTLR